MLLLYCWYTLVFIYLRLRFYKYKNQKSSQVLHTGSLINELTLSHWLLANQRQVFCSVGAQAESARCCCCCMLLIHRFFLYDAYSHVCSHPTAAVSRVILDASLVLILGTLCLDSSGRSVWSAQEPGFPPLHCASHHFLISSVLHLLSLSFPFSSSLQSPSVRRLPPRWPALDIMDNESVESRSWITWV